MGTILAVTGGTGMKTGGAFVRAVSENISFVNEMFPGGIRVLVRASSKTDRIKKLLPDADIMTGALDDLSFLCRAFENVDTVVHIAGIMTSENVVRAAVKCKVRRMILVHTTGVYSKYKAAGEEYRRIDDEVIRLCRESGTVLTICRPTMIYGNKYDNNVIKFIKMVDRFPLMPVVNGARYALQPVHFSDVGNAVYSILVNEKATAGKEYNLSGANETELREMLTVMGRELGKNVHFISCPFFIAYAGACVLYALTFKKKDYREKVRRLCEPRVFSHDDAKNDFGYSPMSFTEGIKPEIAGYLEEKNKKK